MGRSGSRRSSSKIAADVARGLACYERRAWVDAYECLARADRTEPLDADKLERFAMAAYLLGRDDDYLAALERAHRAYAEAGAPRRAVRCAFWLGLRYLFRGKAARATGWFACAQRLLEEETEECAERGYLLLPLVEQRLATGDGDSAHAVATAAAAVGERCGDSDLVVLARHLQGRALMAQGRVADGLALLDETMLAVAAGTLSPLVAGLVYCSVIDGCRRVYALEHAREWTAALAAWCAEQPDMVAFSGTCLVHRAEILQLHGDWDEAMVEARRADARLSAGTDRRAHAAALYQQAEVHRLRGDFAAAESAYRDTSRRGRDPQPGLALLRLAQGRTAAALAAIRRAAATVSNRLERARLLPPLVEILLAAGEPAEARTACADLDDIARLYDTRMLHAAAAQARGTVALAGNDPQTALGMLRGSCEAWQELEAPYFAARVRVLVGCACRALGDGEGCGMELAAARSVFERLGARPDVVHIDSIVGADGGKPPGALTRRELQVLRLIARGMTNKAIAADLFLSEKTVDRHVSNILAKLDVSSRAAATAYGYEHALL